MHGHVEFRSFVLCFFSGCKQIFNDWLLTSFGREEGDNSKRAHFFSHFYFFPFFFFIFLFFVFFRFSFFSFFRFFRFHHFFGGGKIFPNFHEKTPQRVGRERKKDEDLGGPVKEESKGERPNLGCSDAHRTDTPHDTTTNNTMGDPAQGGFGPLDQGFLGSRMVLKGAQNTKRPSGPKEVRAKCGQIKNNNQKNVAFLVPSLPFL